MGEYLGRVKREGGGAYLAVVALADAAAGAVAGDAVVRVALYPAGVAGAAAAAA